MIAGSVLGWSIDTELRFEFLRDAPGQETLTVAEWNPDGDPSEGGELAVRWRPRPGRPFSGEVHQMPDGDLTVYTSDSSWFRISPGSRHIDIPEGVDSMVREARLWTTPMLLLAALKGRLSFHAACVVIDNRAIALSAPGHFGKTTLAAALLDRGHGLLAEDTTVLEASGRVLPGPDLLRLRPDAISRMGRNVSSYSMHETEDRIMVRTGTEISGPVPLSAIVFLKADSERSFRQRSDMKRLADLWQVAFHLPNLSDRNRTFAGITQVADSIPIYDLRRPMTWDSLAWSVEAIEELTI